MTFSICVREPYEAADGSDQLRFGVAVTTRLPGVGTLCPFVNEHGAVATQSLVNVDLGRKGVAYLADGLAVEDALRSLLNADPGSAQRQLHGVDDAGSFVFSGDECRPWYGHVDRGDWTVAGNLLAGEEVIGETSDAYEATRHARPAGPEAPGDADPLAGRLIGALAAGQAVGGDRREELTVQSAAVRVATTEDLEDASLYDDLRVDASEAPIDDLRSTYELAYRGTLDLVERSDDG